MAADELSQLFNDGDSMSEDAIALTDHLAKLAVAGGGLESMVEVASQLRTAWREFHDRVAIMSSVVVRFTLTLTRFVTRSGSPMCLHTRHAT